MGWRTTAATCAFSSTEADAPCAQPRESRSPRREPRSRRRRETVARGGSELLASTEEFQGAESAADRLRSPSLLRLPQPKNRCRDQVAGHHTRTQLSGLRVPQRYGIAVSRLTPLFQRLPHVGQGFRETTARTFAR